jgi:histone-binding protein RBBP4
MDNENPECSKQKLILGTHTDNGEQNYLMVAEVRIPVVPGAHHHSCGEPAQATGPSTSSSARVQVKRQIKHSGEVNRARYMPSNTSIVATKTISAEVYLFDCSKQDTKPSAGGACSPDLRLCGHTAEGYGLAWSPLLAGQLLSGADDSLICLWDINAPAKANKVACHDACMLLLL